MKRRLTATEVVANLAKLDNWRLNGDGDQVVIEKTFTFDSFHQTMAFVNALAFIAHGKNHHPELVLRSQHCVVRYQTHDVSGITLADFESATRVDALLTPTPA